MEGLFSWLKRQIIPGLLTYWTTELITLSANLQIVSDLINIMIERSLVGEPNEATSINGFVAHLLHKRTDRSRARHSAIVHINRTSPIHYKLGFTQLTGYYCGYKSTINDSLSNSDFQITTGDHKGFTKPQYDLDKVSWAFRRLILKPYRNDPEWRNISNSLWHGSPVRCLIVTLSPSQWGDENDEWMEETAWVMCTLGI